ncbi:MAG: ATP cone domain-containing protein, partial [Verrucomicrobiota bacterium]
MSTFTLSNDIAEEAFTGEFPQVIRRDVPHVKSEKPRVVAWVGSKIAHAVRAAALAAGAEASIGEQVQAEVEFRLKHERPLFIHIEQLQDLVEETLMELGHGKVALTYAKYRARRSALREIKLEPPAADETQLELASREQLVDIRARLSYARIGLHLTLSEEDLIARMLRSVSMNLSADEQRETIILNAKNLLDVDADSRFFAGRILLSYIYEETLPWKIADGIGAGAIALGGDVTSKADVDASVQLAIEKFGKLDIVVNNA